MKGLGSVMCVIVAFAAVGWAQTPEPSPIQLEIKGVTRIDLEPTLFYENASCDKKGDLFVGKYDVAGDNPLLKISREGKVTAKFLPADRESPGRFYVNRDGDVYELYEDAKRNNMLARYDSSGQVSSRVRLGAEFKVAGKFGVYKSGEILVAMFDQVSEGLTKPYTALFDQNGKLVKRIVLEDDDRISAAAKERDQSLVPSQINSKSNTAVLNSSVLIGSDGNAYLMRMTTPALIYAISPAGDVLRKINVSAEASGLHPSEMFETDGQLAIVFAGWYGSQPDPASRIQFVDRQTGEISRTYDQRRDIAGLVACIDDGGAVLSFGVENKRPVLHQLGPK